MKNYNRFTIVFTGKMRAGKDFAQAMLLDLMPTDAEFKRIALADELKTIVAKIHGISLEDLEKNKAKYRKDLILIGKAGRLINPDLWVSYIKTSVMKYNTMITDARFKNELGFFEALEDFNLSDEHRTITVRIQASDEIRLERGAQEEFFNDPSEVDLDDIPDSAFDFIIVNNTNDPDDLKSQLLHIRNYVMQFF